MHNNDISDTRQYAVSVNHFTDTLNHPCSKPAESGHLYTSDPAVSPPAPIPL